MNADVIILLKLSAVFLVLFVFAEFLFHVLKIKAEHTRKVVHAGTGFLTLLFPAYLEHLWQVIVICSGFLLLLLLSRKMNFLRSINAVKRKTTGSILYPVIVVAVFAYYQSMKENAIFASDLNFYIPILVMALADPVAALVGEKYGEKKGIVLRKSTAGSIGFFVTAVIVMVAVGSFYPINLGPLSKIIFFIAAALATTLAERFSSGGWDNFTIPVAAIAVMYITTIIAS